MALGKAIYVCVRACVCTCAFVCISVLCLCVSVVMGAVTREGRHKVETGQVYQ